MLQLTIPCPPSATDTLHFSNSIPTLVFGDVSCCNHIEIDLILSRGAGIELTASRVYLGFCFLSGCMGVGIEPRRLNYQWYSYNYHGAFLVCGEVGDYF